MGIFKRTDSPNWWYRVQLNHRVLTGSTNTPDKRLAYRIYLNKHRQLIEERYLPNEREGDRTFFQMCDLYVENYSKINKSTWKDDERIIKKLQRFFGDCPLISIGAENVEKYKGSRRGFVKDATINRELTILKGILSKAVTWGYLRQNPAAAVRLYKEERAPIKILGAEERKRLIEVAPEHLKPILVMALKTGMRKGEILNLKWKNVNLEYRTLSVTHTKSRKLREVPIHAELEEFLTGIPKASEFVFCDSRGRQLSAEAARKVFDKAKRQAGLPDLTFHALRHNFASELVAKGADLRTVQDYMGHSSLSLLQRYAHVSEGIWRSTIQILGRDTTPPQPKAGTGPSALAKEENDNRTKALR